MPQLKWRRFTFGEPSFSQILDYVDACMAGQRSVLLHYHSGLVFIHPQQRNFSHLCIVVMQTLNRCNRAIHPLRRETGVVQISRQPSRPASVFHLLEQVN